MAKGFAIKTERGIDIRTVGPTARSAKVNWLWAEKQCMLYPWTTDVEIEGLWKQFRCTGEPAFCVSVDVTETKSFAGEHEGD